MSAGRYTRTGAHRAGDDYQDLVAIGLFVEWLEHPDRYIAMRMEADEVGALDDIVAKRADGGWVVRQVKFATNPDNMKTAFIVNAKFWADNLDALRERFNVWVAQ